MNATTRGLLNREFQDIYLMMAEPRVNTYRLGYPEVAAVYECDLAGLCDLVFERTQRLRIHGKQVDAERSTVEIVDRDADLTNLIAAAREYHKVLFPAITRILFGIGPTPETKSEVDLPDGSR